MIRHVVDFALNQRLLVIALALLLFGAGIVAFHTLPIEAYPDVANYSTTYTLSIGRSGNGTVTATPDGVDRPINCGAECSAKFIPGTIVTLTATPAPGATFVSWTNSCVSSTPTCTVVINKDTTAQANFQ